MEERLQKYMAKCGVASRRKCEEIIQQGRVKVNDNIVTEMGYKIDTKADVVKVDNDIIKTEENKVYIALNKPVGYISTVKDERGRKTILDLVDIPERVYPIGRLDYDSSGLLLITNDGEVFNKIIHPREVINKVYLVEVEGQITKEDAVKFHKGIDIGGYITAPAKLEIIHNKKSTSEIKVTIHEGKNRQVRRMCGAIGHPVISLNRESIGNINLNDLPLGKWRYLTNEEIKYINNL